MPRPNSRNPSPIAFAVVTAGLVVVAVGVRWLRPGDRDSSAGAMLPAVCGVALDTCPRALVIRLNDGWHVAYDTENGRIHAFWHQAGPGVSFSGLVTDGQSEGLNRISGVPLWSEPRESPWKWGTSPARHRHLGWEQAKDGGVRVVRELQSPDRQTVVRVEEAPAREVADGAWERSFVVAGMVSEGLSLDLPGPSSVWSVRSGPGRLESASLVFTGDGTVVLSRRLP